MATFAPSVHSLNYGSTFSLTDVEQNFLGLNGDEGVDSHSVDNLANSSTYSSYLTSGLVLPQNGGLFDMPVSAEMSAMNPQALMNNMQHNVPARPALSASSASIGSTASSMVGSPAVSEQHYLLHSSVLSAMPIAPDRIGAMEDFPYASDSTMFMHQQPAAIIDSSLSPPLFAHGRQHFTPVGNPLPHYIPRQHTNPGSPALSIGSSGGPSRTGPMYARKARGSSPYLSQSKSWNAYSGHNGEVHRTSSNSCGASSPVSTEADDSEREKNRCPFPDCGRIFKDLKAHMMTHQNERPEKCPIPSCEYNKKGFSRKYDKNRHTLTHYKGTMVCGFCPGSGSSAEKSFNRADVFKRHLMSVHGVEQNPPNSRKRVVTPNGKATSSKDVTGKCSICNGIFSTPQNFYEHLEDCVLSVVQKIEPSEAINEQLLTSVSDDVAVKDTLDRHNLSQVLELSQHVTGGPLDDEKDDDEHDSEGIEDVGQFAGDGTLIGDQKRSGGMTWSKGGVTLHRQGRKRRKNYPISWGANIDKMNLKKRVLTVWDGQRRLAKDDMMLGTEFEVRLNVPDSDTYITDLDVQCLKRADAFHEATEEEKGPPMFTNFPDRMSYSAQDIGGFIE